MSKEKVLEPRKRRVPLGVMRKRMSLDNESLERLKRKGLVPRWINDNNNSTRIQDAINGGYDFVASDGTIIRGDNVNTEEKNRRVKMLVGTHKDGSPKYAYLMAIKKEFYEEDQLRKEDQNMMVDEAIRGGNPRGLKDHGVTPEKGGTYVKKVEYKP